MPSGRKTHQTVSTIVDQHCIQEFGIAYESAHESAQNIDALLRRWARWLRAGQTGYGGIGHGGLKETAYSDAVAEMIDPMIAKLPTELKFAVIDIWYYEKSETAAAEERRMPRGRFKTVLGNATGWLCGAIATRIKATPTIDNCERWLRYESCRGLDGGHRKML